MSRPSSKDIYTMPDWMREYLPYFMNTGGNDVEELLHDDTTTPFANVVRYMLIVSVRAQFDMLVTLRHKRRGALEDTPPALNVESQRNSVLAYADSYRDMAQHGVESIPIWSVITDLERNIAPLFTSSAAPVQCLPDDIKQSINALAKLNNQLYRWTSRMSYNGSWVGEPAGLIKGHIREMEHILEACRTAMLHGGKS